MKVKFKANSIAEVTMTCDQLIILRYALIHGVEKLEQTALFFKARKIKEMKAAGVTARKARRVADSLELANRKVKIYVQP